MKNYLIYLYVLLSAIPPEIFAEAFSGDITFQPRAYMGYANYSLDSSDFTKIVDGEKINEPLNLDLYDHHNLQFSGFLYGIGGTLGYGRFFGDLYYQSTLNETVYSSSDEYPDINTSEYFSDVNARHADWALSLGYMINNQWSIFAGYKAGDTKWNQFIQLNSVSAPKLLQQDNLSVKFEQDGPFIGTSYSFLMDPGVLTIKAAYAYLDGTYKWNLNTFEYGDQSPASQFVNLDGNSNAFSFGVSWTQSLTDNLGVSVGANYHWYKFDMSGTGSVSGDNPRSVELSGGSLTEELFTLTAAMLYRF